MYSFLTRRIQPHTYIFEIADMEGNIVATSAIFHCRKTAEIAAQSATNALNGIVPNSQDERS